MKNHHTCPKCRSSDIIENVRPLDLGHHNAQNTMQLANYAHPDALLFKGKQSTTIWAWVCAECGFVEFYAENPKALKVTGG